MPRFNVTKEEHALMSVASTDVSRPQLLGVHFTEKHAIATDGHIMAIRKKSDEGPNNITLVLPPKPKSKMPILSYLQIEDTEKCVDHNGNIATKIDHDFPSTDHVVPAIDSDDISITFNATLLMRLAAALNPGTTNNENRIVTLRFKQNTTNAILVAGNDPDVIGILMPIRENIENPDPNARVKNVLAR